MTFACVYADTYPDLQPRCGGGLPRPGVDRPNLRHHGQRFVADCLSRNYCGRLDRGRQPHHRNVRAHLSAHHRPRRGPRRIGHADSRRMVGAGPIHPRRPPRLREPRRFPEVVDRVRITSVCIGRRQCSVLNSVLAHSRRISRTLHRGTVRPRCSRGTSDLVRLPANYCAHRILTLRLLDARSYRGWIWVVLQRLSNRLTSRNRLKPSPVNSPNSHLVDTVVTICRSQPTIPHHSRCAAPPNSAAGQPSGGDRPVALTTCHPTNSQPGKTA
jgi:hypothetical protein